MNRRNFLQTSVLAGLGLSVHQAAAQDAYPPAEAITQGPGYHWFGYYDKWQVDPTGRYALGCRVAFEGRSPTEHDTLRIGTIDLHDRYRWTACRMEWFQIFRFHYLF